MTWFKKKNPKDQLRAHMRQALSSLSFEQLIEKSDRLNQHFFDFVNTHPQLKGKVIVSFCPFENEPQINIERGVNVDPYQVAYVRITDWKNRQMHAHLARRDLPGQWEEIKTESNVRIFHPMSAQPICDSGEVSIILVPGLAFGRDGERLGRGAGFYDRFLKLYPHALRMGIAFQLQVVDTIPLYGHDEHIDVLLTEEGIVKRYAYEEWLKEGRVKRRP